VYLDELVCQFFVYSEKLILASLYSFSINSIFSISVPSKLSKHFILLSILLLVMVLD